MYSAYKRYIINLHNTGKYRKLTGAGQGKVSRTLDFSNNDYLDLSQHPAVKQAAVDAIQHCGLGAKASRAVVEYHDIHAMLEAQIAQDKHTEAALIFPSGFQVNVSVLSAILDPVVLKCQPLVFFDRLNHSSLYQALFLSRCQWVRYRHVDMEHLETLLMHYAKETRPKFIVTETVFGMDGDIAPLPKLKALAQHYKTFLYLDEAHATGIFGPEGYGCSTYEDLSAIPHVVMGTFSKALGCSGGYIACSQVIKDYLVNKATGFIYSTGISPVISSAVLEAWKRIKSMHEERAHLHKLGEALRAKGSALGYPMQNSQTHIVPIVLKEEDAVLRSQKFLKEKGIYVSAIRPPTVTPGTARLRIALRASHTLADIDRLVEALSGL